MLQRRLQIMIDDARFQRLQGRARDQGISVAAVIRNLVDAGVPAEDAARQAAAARIIDNAPAGGRELEPVEIRAMLDEAHDRA
ncbi:MAG: hypothetical protein H7287_00995 [Thermoleophilia bacterium]|nr:hypothetical protein [Thermoleophilia bacterium]